MYQISLILSGLLTMMFAPRRIVRVVDTVVEERLDPRGLVHHDIEFIKRECVKKPVHWAAGMTLDQIAHLQGQHDLIRIIETRVIGRRTDGQPTLPSRK